MEKLTPYPKNGVIGPKECVIVTFIYEQHDRPLIWEGEISFTIRVLGQSFLQDKEDLPSFSNKNQQKNSSIESFESLKQKKKNYFLRVKVSTNLLVF